MNKKLFDFIDAAPTAFHAVEQLKNELGKQGFTELYEAKPWQISKGGRYYVTRNGSSLIAFKVPKAAPTGFMMTAAHADSPAFKIKENAELRDSRYVRLSTEKYGGMLCAPWFDRPLSVAGRVMIRTSGGVKNKLVTLPGTNAVIPSLAIHMNPKANQDASYNPAVDMLPLFCTGGENKSRDFYGDIAAEIGVDKKDILSADLFLYNPEKGVEWGDFISAPRLDDLQCVYASKEAFLKAENAGAVPVLCVFDNEEVGSTTKQGAASTFLFDTLLRLCDALGISDSDYRRLLSAGFLVSCDNAHAIHPAHPEVADPNHTVYLNGGIVIKYNANQKYTSDAVSTALFSLVCEKAGVKLQKYANRADMPGGSTLGNISNTQVSLNTVDIGLPQLAMHSPYETAGARDTEDMVKALTVFFESAIIPGENGDYTLQ